MDITPLQAGWFLVLTLPSCLWSAWSDMKSMKIPNRATDLMLAVFVVAGLFLMPTWADYFWRFAHFGVVLAVGLALNTIRLMGAGDVKFLAAAAPFVALGDAGNMIWIYAACLLATFVLHRIARATPLRNLAPDWVSWTTGKRFPMGLAFGATMIAYFVLGLTGLPRI